MESDIIEELSLSETYPTPTSARSSTDTTALRGKIPENVDGLSSGRLADGGDRMGDGRECEISCGWSQASNSLVDFPFSPPSSPEISRAFQRKGEAFESGPLFAARFNDIWQPSVDAIEYEPYFPCGYDDIRWNDSSWS